MASSQQGSWDALKAEKLGNAGFVKCQDRSLSNPEASSTINLKRFNDPKFRVLTVWKNNRASFEPLPFGGSQSFSAGFLT